MKNRKTASFTLRLSEKEYNFYKKIYKLLGFKTLSEFIVASLEHGINEVLENDSIKQEYTLKIMERASDQVEIR